MMCSYYLQSLAQIRGAIREDRKLDLGELTRGCCSSREFRSHRSDRCKLLLSFARVNVLVSSLLSRVAAVSSLGQFGAW
jgi:hypothetical protein